MRLATWNVNSVKQRIGRLLPWLEERAPDVVCLQETKLADEAFGELLGEELGRRGYEAALYGEAQWNGVAILSRVGLEDVERGFPGAPGFPHQEARAVAATCAGVRVHSIYVPNGRVPDSDHYATSSSGWRRSARRSGTTRAGRSCAGTSTSPPPTRTCSTPPPTRATRT